MRMNKSLLALALAAGFAARLRSSSRGDQRATEAAIAEDAVETFLARYAA